MRKKIKYFLVYVATVQNNLSLTATVTFYEHKEVLLKNMKVRSEESVPNRLIQLSILQIHRTQVRE